MSEELEELLTQVPERLRSELQRIPPEDAFVLAEQFLASDETDQAGMMDFIDDQGPRRVRELGLEHCEGVPTADDLEGWVND